MRRMLAVLLTVSSVSAFAEIDLADHGGAYTVTENDLSESFVNSGDEKATLTFDCAAATTFSGSISGDIKVAKAGSSTLDVTTVNAFTGGVALDAGTINFTVAGSLGDGTVTIASGATLNLAAAVECANPIHLKSKTSTVKFASAANSASAGFTGDITGESGVTSFTPSLAAAGVNYRFAGSIDLPNAQLTSPTKQSGAINFSGRVNVASLYSISSSHPAGLRFSSSDNTWKSFTFRRYDQNSAIHRFQSGSIAPGSYIYHNANNASRAAYGNIEVYGDQMLSHIYTSGASYKFQIDSKSEGVITFTNAAKMTTYPIFTGPMGLVLDSDPASTWSISNGVSTMTGSIVVSNGAMVVSGSANFSAIPSLTVGENAKFAFVSSAASPLAKLRSVEVASGGTFEIGEGVELSALTSFTVGGKPPKGYGWFTGSDNENPQEGDKKTIAQLKGEGRVYIPYQGSDSAVTWDGGAGTDTSVGNAANWEGDELPDFTGGLTATFAAGGRLATFVEPTVLKSIVFTDGEGFELAASGTGEVELGEGLAVAAHAVGDVTPTNRISVPITLAGAQAWTVGESSVLELRAPVSSAAATLLSFAGKGPVRIYSTNDFTGTLILSNASTAVYTKRGAFGTATDGSKVQLRNDLGAKLTLGGTTIEKDFQLTKPSGNNQGGITFAAGVTNVFAGRFTTGSNWTPFLKNSQYVKFIGGGDFATYFRPEMNSGTVIEFAETPVSIWTGFKLNGGTIVFSVSSNQVDELQFEQRSTLSLKAEHAFKNAPDLWFEKNTGVNPVPVLLNGNDQGFGSLTINNPHAYIETPAAAPATLTLVQSTSDIAPENDFFRGPISIVKKGAKAMTFNGATRSTGGSIRVEEGTLAFGASGKWSSATNVTVSGSTAVLSVANSAALPKSCTIRVENGGKIDVAAGTVVRAKEIWFGDRRICGTYTAADYPDYITGEGAVRGSGLGIMVIVR